MAPTRRPCARKPQQDDALPGVQKLKSALRQTRRLLARDHLAADVRVETERRLKALETDLARAEHARRERHYAAKYHRIKFFERQKVLRKIHQVKRSMTTVQDKTLALTLADLRVDLNYVLHFPKTTKYVSLFPPEVRHSDRTAAPVSVSSGDNDVRSNVRDMIRQRMEHGELCMEPENELGKQDQHDRQLTSSQRGANMTPRSRTDDVAGDEFFGDDDEVDSQQSPASDP